MGRSKRFVDFSLDGLLASMVPDICYQLRNVARAYGRTTAETRALLDKAVRAGSVLRIPHPKGARYQLPAAPKAKIDRVAPPYPNIRLDQDLIGYDRELRRFAELCVLVRQ